MCVCAEAKVIVEELYSCESALRRDKFKGSAQLS